MCSFSHQIHKHGRYLLCQDLEEVTYKKDNHTPVFFEDGMPAGNITKSDTIRIDRIVCADTLDFRVIQLNYKFYFINTSAWCVDEVCRLAQDLDKMNIINNKVDVYCYEYGKIYVKEGLSIYHKWHKGVEVFSDYFNWQTTYEEISVIGNTRAVSVLHPLRDIKTFNVKEYKNELERFKCQCEFDFNEETAKRLCNMASNLFTVNMATVCNFYQLPSSEPLFDDSYDFVAASLKRLNSRINYKHKNRES
jgi:hypothetical protein